MKPMRTSWSSILLALVWCSAPAQEHPERTMAFRQHPLAAAIDSLSRWYAIPIIYREADVQGRTITFSCTACTFDEALMRMLAGSPLDAVAAGRQVIIRQRQIIAREDDGTVAGTVRDAVTGDPIAGAVVVLRRQDQAGTSAALRVCPTNGFGFYSLRSIPRGEYLLETRCVGYLIDLRRVAIVMPEAARHDVALRQSGIALDEMTVEGERMTGATGSGLARGLFIRSIPGDPNEYLLDGARIYNPAHFGGVLSSFHPEALNEIEIGKTGLPPSFGGRIGGMLDLSLRDGMRESMTGTAGADLLGMHASLEGPIDRSTSFLVTARRGWPDAQIAGLSQHGVPTRLGTGEIIGKLTHRLSSGSTVSAHAYMSSDQYTNGTTSGAGPLTNDLRWWNASYNCRWSAIVTSSLFAHAAVTYTRYGLDFAHALGPADGVVMPSTYAIDDVTLRAEMEHYYDASHTFGGGLEITRHSIEGSISAFDAVIAPFRIEAQEVWDIAMHVRDRIALTGTVSAEIGVRATSFIGRMKTMSGIDPRLALHVALSPTTRGYLTFASINQFMHPYRQSGTFLCYPAPFWYPSDGDRAPTTSVQFAGGVIHDLAGSDIVFGAEVFYRYASQVQDARWTTPSQDDLGAALISGSGRAYGIDLSLRKRTGPVSGAVSYTYAHTERWFGDVNGGSPFTPPFSPAHEVHVSIGYVPDDDWLFGALAVLDPGRWEGTDGVSMASAPIAPVDVSGLRFALPGEFSDVNGSRLPGFERLEFTVSRRIRLGGLSGSMSLRLINGYGLLDPVEWIYTTGEAGRPMWRARVRPVALFPLFPVVGLSIRV